MLLCPPGTGKTHVAIAISIRACFAGQRVQFATATEWVARLADHKRQGTLEAAHDCGRRELVGLRRGDGGQGIEGSSPRAAPRMLAAPLNPGRQRDGQAHESALLLVVRRVLRVPEDGYELPDRIKVQAVRPKRVANTRRARRRCRAIPIPGRVVVRARS